MIRWNFLGSLEELKKLLLRENVNLYFFVENVISWLFVMLNAQFITHNVVCLCSFLQKIQANMLDHPLSKKLKLKEPVLCASYD